MKLLLFGVILSLNISAKAVEGDCKHCAPGLSGTADKSIPSDLRKLAAVHTQLDPVQLLGSKICYKFKTSGDIGQSVNDLLVDYITTNNLGSGDSKSVVNFLNKNKDLLSCEELSLEDVRRGIVKIAISRNRMKPVTKYLFKISKEAGVPMDFNSVDFVQGEFETPLDYIDKIMAGKTHITMTPYLKKELPKLRSRLIKRFKAKKFSELPVATQNRYKTENGLYASR